MNLRIVAEEQKPDLTVKTLTKASSSAPSEAAISGTSNMIFAGKTFQGSPVYSRLALQHGHHISGPCVITEMDSNTVILPDCYAEIDHVGNILIFEDSAASTASEGERTGKPRCSTSTVPEPVSPVVVDIFESALRNARAEMDTLMTTATMSPAIREQQDEFNVIAEPSGKMLAGQFGSFIPQFLSTWTGTIEPDDIFLTNDPYSVGGAISHLNDWLVMIPVFSPPPPPDANRTGEEAPLRKLIAWTSNFGHMTDNGGSVPGSLPTAAPSIFSEGLQIPPLKLASNGGIYNEAILSLLHRNGRLPAWTRCDLLALVAACKLAAKRMVELYTRFGDKGYFGAVEELLERNRRTVGRLIEEQIPEAPVEFEDWLDDDGRGVGPWKVKCKMIRSRVKGENGMEEPRLTFDFDGTDPQCESIFVLTFSPSLIRLFSWSRNIVP